LRRNTQALTPSQKENVTRKRASWSPAGSANANMKPVSEININAHRRVPSAGAVREAIEEKPLHQNFVNGVDLLQCTSSNSNNPQLAHLLLNPYPDVLGMCDTNPFNSAFPNPDQSKNFQIQVAKPIPLPGPSVSAPPTPNCEFPPSKIATSRGEPPLLPKKKVRFRSSPNSIQRQRSLLDVDMGEDQDIHYPLMEYTPQTCIPLTPQPPTEAPLLIDLNF